VEITERNTAWCLVLLGYAHWPGRGSWAAFQFKQQNSTDADAREAIGKLQVAQGLKQRGQPLAEFQKVPTFSYLEFHHEKPGMGEERW
jgi:hypothetical protein